jgi:2-amino-4-hydroxy-6-hydroxymethyldihydropteridine diphosphokinase
LNRGVHSAYVGIGSNLGAPAGNVRRAIEALSELGRVTRRSSLYRTKPWGKPDQPDFVNAVVLLETSLGTHALLAGLKALERRLGRRDGERWGPRAIDLDLLTYDDLVLAHAGLRVPHPHLFERAFVLVPLAEIDARYAAARDALGSGELAGVRILHG